MSSWFTELLESVGLHQSPNFGNVQPLHFFSFLSLNTSFFLRLWRHECENFQYRPRGLWSSFHFFQFFFSVLFKLDNFHYIHLQIHSFLSHFHLSIESNQRLYSSYYTVKLKYFYWLPILGTSSMIFLHFHPFQRGHITYWSIFVITAF